MDSECDVHVSILIQSGTDTSRVSRLTLRSKYNDMTLNMSIENEMQSYLVQIKMNDRIHIKLMLSYACVHQAYVNVE